MTQLQTHAAHASLSFPRKRDHRPVARVVTCTDRVGQCGRHPNQQPHRTAGFDWLENNGASHRARVGVDNFLAGSGWWSF